MKSQISIEFIVGVGILIIIYAISLTLFSSYAEHNVIETERGRQECYILSSAIDSAAIGGNNFAMNVSMNEKLGGTDYFAFVDNKSVVTISWENGVSSCTTTTQNVKTVFFRPCKISLNNLDSMIYISYVNYEVDEEEINLGGKYYIGNVILEIYKNGNLIEEVEIETDNYQFQHTIDSSPGEYIIYAKSVEIPTMTSRTRVII